MTARNQLNPHEEAPSKTDVSMIFSLLFWNEPSPSEHLASVRTTIKAATLETWLNQSVVQNPNTTGAVALVDVPGQIDWLAAVGSEDTGQQLKMTRNSRFAFSTLAEPMIATLVLQLVENNKLSLQEPVCNYLDEHLLDLLTDGYGRELTILQLLNHNSGICDYRNLPGTEAPVDLMELIQACLEHGNPKAAPGTECSPVATNYALLGLVLEAVEGVHVRELLQRRILNPLGMHQTEIGVDPILGMEGTVADLRRFLHALASGILLQSDTTLQQMLSASCGSYGLGIQHFGLDSHMGKVWGAIGTNPEFSIYMMYAEKYDAILVYGARHFYGPLHYPRFFSDLVLNHLTL